MTELERYLRVYLTKRIKFIEDRIQYVTNYQIDYSDWESIVNKLQGQLDAYKDVLEELDINKEMMG